MYVLVSSKHVSISLRSSFAMVSMKKHVHMVCIENTADFSRPANNELHPSTGKAPSETGSNGRDVSEMLVMDEF